MEEEVQNGQLKYTDAMELAQIEGPANDSGEMLFFMEPDDLQLRDMETTGDLDYWEGDLDEEQTTIAELVQGGRQNDRAHGPRQRNRTIG